PRGGDRPDGDPGAGRDAGGSHEPPGGAGEAAGRRGFGRRRSFGTLGRRRARGDGAAVRARPAFRLRIRASAAAAGRSAAGDAEENRALIDGEVLAAFGATHPLQCGAIEPGLPRAVKPPDVKEMVDRTIAWFQGEAVPPAAGRVERTNG